MVPNNLAEAMEAAQMRHMNGSSPTRSRILVPVAGSEFEPIGIELAATTAARLDAEVILLRVIAPPSEPMRARRGGRDVQLGLLIDRLERQADIELQRAQAHFAGTVVTRVVLVGEDPAVELVDWLREHPVDFVVMATHAHRGLRHLFGGGVTEAVLRSGLAPVIAVRAA